MVRKKLTLLLHRLSFHDRKMSFYEKPHETHHLQINRWFTFLNHVRQVVAVVLNCVVASQTCLVVASKLSVNVILEIRYLSTAKSLIYDCIAWWQGLILCESFSSGKVLFALLHPHTPARIKILTIYWNTWQITRLAKPWTVKKKIIVSAINKQMMTELKAKIKQKCRLVEIIVKLLGKEWAVKVYEEVVLLVAVVKMKIFQIEVS